MANTWNTATGFNATNIKNLHSTTGVGKAMDGTGTAGSGDYVPLAEIRSELFRNMPLYNLETSSFALFLFRQSSLSRILGQASFGQTVNIRMKGLPKVQNLGADCAITATKRLGKNISVTLDQQRYVNEDMCPCFSDNPCGDNALYDINDVAELRMEYDRALTLEVDNYFFNSTNGLLKSIPVTTKDGETYAEMIVKTLAVIQDKALEAQRVISASELPILVNPATLADLKLDANILGEKLLNTQAPLNFIVGAQYKGTFEGHPVYTVPSSIVSETVGFEIIDVYGVGVAIACEVEKVTDGGANSLKTGYVKMISFGGAVLEGVDNLSVKGKALTVKAP